MSTTFHTMIWSIGAAAAQVFTVSSARVQPKQNGVRLNHVARSASNRTP